MEKTDFVFDPADPDACADPAQRCVGEIAALAMGWGAKVIPEIGIGIWVDGLLSAIANAAVLEGVPEVIAEVLSATARDLADPAWRAARERAMRGIRLQ
jgi:hypothetical protein